MSRLGLLPRREDGAVIYRQIRRLGSLLLMLGLLWMELGGGRSEAIFINKMLVEDLVCEPGSQYWEKLPWPVCVLAGAGVV
jgi:hypothetical protein